MLLVEAGVSFMTRYGVLPTSVTWNPTLARSAGETERRWSLKAGDRFTALIRTGHGHSPKTLAITGGSMVGLGPSSKRSTRNSLAL